MRAMRWCTQVHSVYAHVQNVCTQVGRAVRAHAQTVHTCPQCTCTASRCLWPISALRTSPRRVGRRVYIVSDQRNAYTTASPPPLPTHAPWGNGTLRNAGTCSGFGPPGGLECSPHIVMHNPKNAAPATRPINPHGAHYRHTSTRHIPQLTPHPNQHHRTHHTPTHHHTRPEQPTITNATHIERSSPAQFSRKTENPLHAKSNSVTTPTLETAICGVYRRVTRGFSPTMLHYV